MAETGVSRRGVQGVLKRWRDDGFMETKNRPGWPVPKNVCLFSPDCNPLNFSMWARLAAAVCKTKPRNR